ncbi:class I SAM-dependent methyltransferase [Kitasatospora sp. NPDC002227]|uniref:class I SAM-dependent methyltransferase n=1 Tax=Kitasatospora sp. NPDC002227 TaxID=3154773 RepID=UPI003318D77D
MPKFDGLADSYDRTRPRYPAALFSAALALLPTGRPLTVADAGAGTGIALETLLPLLPAGSTVHAVDISADMIRLGREKFPRVHWAQGTAEEHLGRLTGLDLVLAAQAYQWLDRPAYLRAAAAALRPGGFCLIVQNNRDHGRGGFAAAYEDLLEACSPGYTRTYRSIDVAGELATVFGQVARHECRWEQALTVEGLVTMSSSSTQAQRAVTAVGPAFLDQVRELAERHAVDGLVRLPYLSEAFHGAARG